MASEAREKETERKERKKEIKKERKNETTRENERNRERGKQKATRFCQKKTTLSDPRELRLASGVAARGGSPSLSSGPGASAKWVDGKKRGGAPGGLQLGFGPFGVSGGCCFFFSRWLLFLVFCFFSSFFARGDCLCNHFQVLFLFTDPKR